MCFGEALLRLNPAQGDLLRSCGNLNLHTGGAEANVAASLARLGLQASFVTVLPSNGLGERARDVLRSAGVSTAEIELRDGRMGLYFLEQGAVTRPSQVIYDRKDSAFARHASTAFDWRRILDGANWLHVSGITPAIGPDGTKATLGALSQAVAMGVAVSFDGNFRDRLWSSWQSAPQQTLSQCFAAATLAFADDRDFNLVLGIDFDSKDPIERGVAAAKAALRAFPKLQRIAFTVRRQEGVEDHQLRAVLVSRSEVYETGPINLANVIDRVGGGDAFAAGLLAGIAKGWADNESLEFALAATVLKHSVVGDFNPFSTHEIQTSRQMVWDIQR